MLKKAHSSALSDSRKIPMTLDRASEIQSDVDRKLHKTVRDEAFKKRTTRAADKNHRKP